MLALGFGVTSAAVLPGIVDGMGNLLVRARAGDEIHAFLPTAGNPPSAVPSIRWRLDGMDIDGGTGISIIVPDATGILSWAGTDSNGQPVNSAGIVITATFAEPAPTPSITVTSSPSAAGLETVSEGEIVSAVLARLTQTGTATTTGPGLVTTTPALIVNGAAASVLTAADVIEVVRFTYSAAGAADVVVDVAVSITVQAIPAGPYDYTDAQGETWTFAAQPASIIQTIDGVTVVPPGTEIIARSTARADIGGTVKNGTMLNPAKDALTQGFSGERNGFNIGHAVDFPVTLTDGDILMGSVDAIPVTGKRDGPTEIYPTVIALASLPSEPTLAPSLAAYDNKIGIGHMPVVTDAMLDAMLARLPEQAVIGEAYPDPDQAIYGLRLNPGSYSMFNKANPNTVGSYEQAMPRTGGGVSRGSVTTGGDDHYARHAFARMSEAVTLLYAPTSICSQVQKRKILIGLLSFAHQYYRPVREHPERLYADGGHRPGLLQLAYLYAEFFALPQSEVDQIYFWFRGNNEQSFRVTQDMIDNLFVPFGDPDDLSDVALTEGSYGLTNGDRPYGWHRRRITDVVVDGSNKRYTLQTFRGGAGGKQGDYQKTEFADLLMSDGTSSFRVLQGSGTDVGSGLRSKAITLPGACTFVAGDVIWFEPAYPLYPGFVDWCVEGTRRFNFYLPTRQADYRDLQSDGMLWLLAKDLGILHTDAQAAYDYHILAALTDLPTAQDVFPSTFQTDLVRLFFEGQNITSVPAPPAVTFTTDPTAGNLTEILAGEDTTKILAQIENGVALSSNGNNVTLSVSAIIEGEAFTGVFAIDAVVSEIRVSATAKDAVTAVFSLPVDLTVQPASSGGG